MSWCTSNTHLLTNGYSIFDMKNQQRPLSNLSRLCAQIQQRFSALVDKPGVHSSITLEVAGFRYTGKGDTARCEECGLEVSNWTLDMKPWAVHSTQCPNCPFVRRLKADAFSGTFSSLSRATTVEQANPSKRRKSDLIDLESPTNNSVEADLFQQAQRCIFSDWPHRSTPSKEHMIKAGFLACNVGDRVICIYCNTVIHRWTPHADEPCGLHKMISPHCPYVKEKLSNDEQPRVINSSQNLTGAPTDKSLSERNSTYSLRFSRLLRPPAQNITNRVASRPSTVSSTRPIADSIRDDCLYPRIQHDETCVECQKSLQNMGPCDSQMTECARWFVHCTHTKQYTADQVYHQIQKFKQAQRSMFENNDSKDNTGSDGILNTNPTTNSQQSTRINGNISSILAAARLDLQIPKQISDRDFSLSILQRVWGNELDFKRDDSTSDAHLLLACSILQKQIESIDGKPEQILVPGVKMQEIKEERENFIQRQATARPVGASSSTDVEMMQSNDSTPSNPCVLCFTKEKQLACLPCGHLATCIQCGESLRLCPICLWGITAFVRIFD